MYSALIVNAHEYNLIRKDMYKYVNVFLFIKEYIKGWGAIEMLVVAYVCPEAMGAIK